VKKTYVLDTNVVLHDPLAIYKFEENEVVIPIFVIEEVDQFKKELSELGRNARTIVRILDELRAQEGASLQAGVVLRETGGLLRVSVPKVEPRRSGHGAMDNAILQAALDLRDASPEQPVVFITMDSNLRIRADVLGLRAENYEGGRIDIDELYSGIVTVDTSAELVNALAARENVDITRLSDDTDITRLHPNAGVVLRERGQPKHTALGVHDAKLGALSPAARGQTGLLGRAAAQPRAVLRARPLAAPRGAPGHARGQGRHGQDAAGHRGRAAVRGGRRGLQPHAGQPPHLPSRA
jgi:PhoH-like ATPase